MSSAILMPVAGGKGGVGKSFLTGEGRTPFAANIPCARKQRLLRGLRALPAGRILLDLGTGTSLDTLDFFRISPRGIATSPEPPAIMGILGILKHNCLHTLVRTVARSPLTQRIEELCKRPMTSERLTLRVILDEAVRMDPEAGEAVEHTLRGFRPRLVFNPGYIFT
jgi:flagellar biosynthesis protein FlhG